MICSSINAEPSVAFPVFRRLIYWIIKTESQVAIIVKSTRLNLGDSEFKCWVTLAAVYLKKRANAGKKLHWFVLAIAISHKYLEGHPQTIMTQKTQNNWMPFDSYAWSYLFCSGMNTIILIYVDSLQLSQSLGWLFFSCSV